MSPTAQRREAAAKAIEARATKVAHRMITAGISLLDVERWSYGPEAVAAATRAGTVATS